MKTPLALTLMAATSLLAADKEKVFSGPQPGEKVTPFEVRVITAAGPGGKRDPIKAAGDGPLTLVFLHGLERSMMSLMRVVDQYGAKLNGRLNTDFIFLTDDPLRGDRGLPRVVQSLKARVKTGYSLDGIEGPGNYGLNKECLMTIVVAKGGRVTANFALIQPGIADGPAVVAAMAKAAGDKNPPTANVLLEQHLQLGKRPVRAPLNIKKLDLETDAGRRVAVGKLVDEVNYLRRQLAATRGRPNMRPNARTNPRPKAGGPKKKLPGAVPTDPRLAGMLRQFIQKTNADADVDRVLTEIEKYAKGNPKLLKQACDGLTRVIAVNYGTPYAQMAGRAFIGLHSKK